MIHIKTCTEYLRLDNAISAEKMLKESPEFDEQWIRWWDERTVQLDGDFTVSELKKLVEIMEGFKQITT